MAKVNGYLGWVQSGGCVQAYPDATRGVDILFSCLNEPTGSAELLVNLHNVLTQRYGINVAYQAVIPRLTRPSCTCSRVLAAAALVGVRLDNGISRTCSATSSTPPPARSDRTRRPSRRCLDTRSFLAPTRCDAGAGGGAATPGRIHHGPGTAPRQPGRSAAAGAP